MSTSLLSTSALQERQIIRAELLQCLQQMEYVAFEQVIKRLLYRSGYVTVQFVGRNHKRGRTPKGGLDLTARSITDLSAVLTIAQIKQYERVVSRRFVDELRGTMLRLGAEQGLLITLSRFSRVAHAAAAESKVAPIKLIEGDEILDLLFAHRIGVHEEKDKWHLDSAYLDRVREKTIGTNGQASGRASGQVDRQNQSTKSKRPISSPLGSKQLREETTSSVNNFHETNIHHPTTEAPIEGGAMTWSTHIMAGICSLWVFALIPSAQPEHIAIYAGAAAVGALLPDLDAPRSKIGQWSVGGIKPFFLPSQAINRSVGHRSISHSLLALVFIAGAGLVLSPLVGWQLSLALWIGYASHLLTDASTRSGIPLLYPRPRRFHLLPKGLRIVTGSSAEEVVFAVLATLALFLLLTHFSTLPA